MNSQFFLFKSALNQMRFFPPFIISLTVNSEFSQKKNFFFPPFWKNRFVKFLLGLNLLLQRCDGGEIWEVKAKED